MDRSVLAIGFVAALVLVAPKSYANAIIEETSYSLGAGENAYITYPSNGSVANNEPVFSGQILLNTVANGQLPVWCTDVFHTLVETGFFTAEPLTQNGNNIGLSAITQSEIGWLINNYATSGIVLGDGNEFASATQGAIWETEYGSALTFTSVDPALNFTDLLHPGYVDELVADAAANSSFAITPDEWEPSDSTGHIDLTKNQGQSFIGSPGLTNDVPPVPEPASIALLSAGLLGLGAVRRRKRG